MVSRSQKRTLGTHSTIKSKILVLMLPHLVVSACHLLEGYLEGNGQAELCVTFQLLAAGGWLLTAHAYTRFVHHGMEPSCHLLMTNTEKKKAPLLQMNP
jgi:positive regulator of sigma E activity